jgi:hypothetical protein
VRKCDTDFNRGVEVKCRILTPNKLRPSNYLITEAEPPSETSCVLSVIRTVNGSDVMFLQLFCFRVVFKTRILTFPGHMGRMGASGGCGWLRYRATRREVPCSTPGGILGNVQVISSLCPHAEMSTK